MDFNHSPVDSWSFFVRIKKTVDDRVELAVERENVFIKVFLVKEVAPVCRVSNTSYSWNLSPRWLEMIIFTDTSGSTVAIFLFEEKKDFSF